jgi:hypothetical protein
MIREPEWEVNIVKCTNGFVLSYKEQLDDNSIRIKRLVFEEDRDLGSAAACRDMVNFMAEHFAERKVKSFVIGEVDNETTYD